jgi:hypothetical protein
MPIFLEEFEPEAEPKLELEQFEEPNRHSVITLQVLSSASDDLSDNFFKPRMLGERSNALIVDAVTSGPVSERSKSSK